MSAAAVLAFALAGCGSQASSSASASSSSSSASEAVASSSSAVSQTASTVKFTDVKSADEAAKGANISKFGVFDKITLDGAEFKNPKFGYADGEIGDSGKDALNGMDPGAIIWEQGLGEVVNTTQVQLNDGKWYWEVTTRGSDGSEATYVIDVNGNVSEV